MTEQITKYGPCPNCGGYIKPCKCEDIARIKRQDLKLICAKIEAMEHSGIFSLCPDVLATFKGAVAGALAEIEFEKLSS